MSNLIPICQTDDHLPLLDRHRSRHPDSVAKQKKKSGVRVPPRSESYQELWSANCSCAVGLSQGQAQQLLVRVGHAGPWKWRPSSAGTVCTEALPCKLRRWTSPEGIDIKRSSPSKFRPMRWSVSRGK